MKASLRALWLVVWLLAVSGISTASDFRRGFDWEANRRQYIDRPNCKPDCSGQGLDSMHPPFEYEDYEASPSCPLREFVVITTNGRRCVNRGSILERSLIHHRRTGQDADCKCPDQRIASMNLSLIKDETVYVTPLCPAREIIVTTTDGETCVNPESKLGKSLYQFITTGTPICKCSGQGINSMHPILIKNDQIYEATRFCPRREIIVETANMVKACVNPESNLGKFINRRRAGQLGNCECPVQFASMDLSLIKDYKINEASQFCPGREIIVTTTDGETCVNPESNLATSLYEFNTTGQPICKCSDQGINSMHPRLFKNEQIYEVALFCPRREIIVETANMVKECVNPESNLGTFIILKRAGQHGNCTCSDQGIKSMHLSLIRNHTIYEATQFCPGREIIVTTTNGTIICVNPESNLGNFIYDIRRTGQRGNCKCPDQGIDDMDLSLIKNYQINEASQLCPSREINVTTTNGTIICVNPESILGNDIDQFHRTGTPICKCSGQGINSMYPSLIKNYQIYEVNLFCKRREIIVTTTRWNVNTEECVNPESDLANYIYQLNIPTAGHGVGVGVGVGVSVFVLILICCVCCRKKKANPPTSECESEVHYATVQHPFLNTPHPPPEQIMLHPPPYTPHPPPEQIMLYSTLNVTSHQPGLDHPG